MSEVDDSKPHLRSLFDGEMYELESETIIGRHADCGIVLNRELGASRRHARFNVVDQNVFVTDLGSLNGTLVNGNKIENETRLSNGDKLIFDETEYEVVLATQSAAPEFDPNVTVFINRDEIRKRQIGKADTDTIDDGQQEVATANDDTATQKFTPELSPEASPEMSERVAPEPEPAAPEPEPVAPKPEPIQSQPARTAPEPEPAAPQPAPEPERAASKPAPEPAPVPSKPAPSKSAATLNRPGSWANSADVSNSGGTVIAPGVVAMSTEAAPVDPTSISEPTIIVLSGDNAGKLMPLVGEQTEWSIGSHTDRDLHISQSGVSGNHAAIIREGTKWKVVDQMSINGTFVNGKRSNIRFIDSDDLLRFGPVECRFVVPMGYVSAGKSAKKSGKRFPLWKVAAIVVTLLILAGAYYAYSTGLISLPTSSATTTQ